MASSPTVHPVAVAPPPATRLAPVAGVRLPVPRPRLVQRLHSGPGAGVVLVQAPAGYGKSTLLGQATQVDPRRVIWLTLDERSDDALTFMTGLAFAFGDDGTPDDDLAERLSAGPAGVVPLALPRLLQLVAEPDEPFLLVLDDVHNLTAPAALDVLRALIDHLPPSSTLVLAGRARPDIAVSRLRASGRLVEVTAADLRMTPAEGTALLRGAGADIAEGEGAAAVGRTEGWPAALYLTAIVLRDGDHPDGESLGPRHADLDEYFRDEVLSGAAPRDVEFLVRTAVLDELEPGACDAVLQRSDSAVRLAALARSDLFVAPLGGRSGTYQVHGLFRENLLLELRRSSPGLERELHARASRWFEAREDPENAIRHALAAGDAARASDLVIAQTFRYEAAGLSVILRRWCSRFTDAERHEQPGVAVTLAWCALDAGEAIEAAHWTAVTLGGPADQLLADGVSRGAHGVLLEAAAGTEGVEAVRRAAADADALLPAEHPLRSLSQTLLGCAALMQADRAEAALRLREAERRAASIAPAVYTVALAQQALLALDEDRDADARALLTRAWSFQRGSGLGEYTTQAIVAAARALSFAREGDAERAREEAARATRTLTLSRYAASWLTAQTKLVLGGVAVHLGDLAAARVLLAEARPAATRDPGAVWLHAAVAEIAAQVDEAAVADPNAALTTAELRMLQYLPTHLTQAEIGDRLHLSRNTVKSHTIAIYRKLGVNSRSEAVARGRELGLLEAR